MIEHALSRSAGQEGTQEAGRPVRAPRIAGGFGALFAAALALRLAWATAMGMDGLYGQDAYFILNEGEALLESGRRFTGGSSIGTPAVIAAALALGGGRLAAVQVVLAALGAATVAALVGLARALGLSWRAAWLAGGLLALAPSHVAHSILVMTDGPAVFWLVLGVLGAVLARYDPGRPWVLLAALGLAGAVATRYVTVLVLPPLACYLWRVAAVKCQVSSVSRGSRVKGQGSGDEGSDAPSDDPRPSTLDPRLTWPAAIVLAGAILWLEWSHSRASVPSGHMLAEWSLANAFRREFDDVRGHVLLEYPVGLGYLRALGSWGFLCPFLIPVAALGAWRLRRAPAGVFLVGWAGLHVLFLCGLQKVSPRYLLPALPPITLLAAVGLEELCAGVQAFRRSGVQAFGRSRVFAVRAVLIAGVVLVPAMAGGTYLLLRPLAERKRCELQVARWIDANTPPGSQVAAVDVGLALRRHGHRQVLMLHESDPAAWDLPRGEAAGLYVVWEEAMIRRHMAKQPHQMGLAAALGPHAGWLKTHARLTPVGRVCDWRILRVNALP